MSTNETKEQKLVRLTEEALEIVRSLSVDFQIPYETECWKNYGKDEDTVRLLVDKALSEKEGGFILRALEQVIPKGEPPEVRFQVNQWVKASLRRKSRRRNTYVKLKVRTYAELKLEKTKAAEEASRILRRHFAKVEAQADAERPRSITPYLPGFG